MQMQTFDNENYKKAILNIKAAADSMKLNPSVRHYVKCLREGSIYRSYTYAKCTHWKTDLDVTNGYITVSSLDLSVWCLSAYYYPTPKKTNML